MDREKRQGIRGMIDRHGQMLQSVHASKGDPSDFLPFIYTIGNHEHGLPELLFVAVDIEGFGEMLNMLGELQRDRRRGLSPGEVVDLGGRFPVRIVDAGEIGRTDYAVQAGVFYDTDVFEVRQVLIPDPEGHWPGDPACAFPYSSQPRLDLGHHVM
jgi:hypothetical protein